MYVVCTGHATTATHRTISVTKCVFSTLCCEDTIIEMYSWDICFLLLYSDWILYTTPILVLLLVCYIVTTLV